MSLAVFEFGFGRGLDLDVVGRRESHCSRLVDRELLVVEEF
jgi:hypothetical protein